MNDEVFAKFGMQEVHSSTLQDQLDAAGERLVCIFCWGVDCFNCEVAKKAMLAKPDAIAALDLTWMHGNVYADRDLAMKFGLHGIPVFVFYFKGKKLGVATGWHGQSQFEMAVANARRKAGT